MKTKHDAVLQAKTIRFTTKNKSVGYVSRRQDKFTGTIFALTNMYTCGVLISHRGVNRRCDRRTKGLKFCYAHRGTEDEKMLMRNIWDDGKSTEYLLYDVEDKEVRATTSIYFSQILCRFVGEMDMEITVNSSIKPRKLTSISDPDWGNRMTIGTIEQANCCVEHNSRLGFVVRAVKDLQLDDALVVYDKLCEAMYIEEHVEAKNEWLMGEKTMTQMDNAAHVELDELAKKEKFTDLYMILERPEERSRGLQLMLSTYNQLVSMYRRDVAAARIIKKAHAEAVDCIVNMFHVEYNRVATETQEIIANKVKEAVQYEQQLMDTYVEQQPDSFCEDAMLDNVVKENILISTSNRKRIEGELTIAEAMKEYQKARSLPPEMPGTSTSSNMDTEESTLRQMFAQVIYAHGIIISDERNKLCDVDYNKLIVMPHNIKTSDFHQDYRIHQTITAKKRKYNKLLKRLETDALLQATDPSPEEQADSATRVNQCVNEPKECWMEITSGPEVRVSPRRQGQEKSSNTINRSSMTSSNTEVSTTNTTYIKQEKDAIQNAPRKPDSYTDVLAEIIDMTMETTRVPIKPKRSKAAQEVWRPPQCLWDINRAPTRSPHVGLLQESQYILNAKLKQRPVFTWSRYAHQPITGDGNCLFNCLSFMLTGFEDTGKAKQLR